jgi:hypothetical protein
MPLVSRFFGISIYMYFDDHNPPHFHAIYNEYEALMLYLGYCWFSDSKSVPSTQYQYQEPRKVLIDSTIPRLLQMNRRQNATSYELPATSSFQLSEPLIRLIK